MKKYAIVIAVFAMVILVLPRTVKAGGCSRDITREEMSQFNPTVIDFEDKTIDPVTGYWDTLGVKFSSDTGKPKYTNSYNRGGNATASGEYSLFNNSFSASDGINKPLIITFKEPVNNFGFYFGASNEVTNIFVRYFDKDGVEICSNEYSGPFGRGVTIFKGYEMSEGVYSVTLDYGTVRSGEHIDDFMFVKAVPDLFVSLDSSSPASAELNPGQKDVNFATIKTTARNYDVNNMNGIQFGSDDANVSNLTNFRIFNGATQLPQTSGNLVWGGGYYQDWITVSGFSVPANTSKLLTVVADVKTEATTGTVKLGVAGWNFDLPGAHVEPFGTPIYGNEMTIVIPDKTAPVIILSGNNPTEIYQGDNYEDVGATATDDVDGNISTKIVTVNSVNNQSIGTYTVTYNVSDNAGNSATEVVRTVNVVGRPSSGGSGGGYVGALTVPAPVIPLVVTTTLVPGVTTTEIISQPATTTASTSGETTPKNGSDVQVLGVKINLIDELIASTKFRDKNDDVKLLQSELQKLGFYPKLWLVTGYYGSMTKTSVEKYLASKNVEAGQILGVKINIIDELIAKTKFGERSTNVSTLQSELQKLGFYPSLWRVTGYYGPVTKISVEKYQASQIQ